MKVFVTGATGFIGSFVVPELIQAGHQVVGMTRSEKGEAALKAAGAEAHYGTIEDLDSLRAGVDKGEAVIHLAFNHDFSKMPENSENDRRAIQAMTEALAGSGRRFVATGGVMMQSPDMGRPFDEDDSIATNFPRTTEATTLESLENGVHPVVVRLSQIHNPHRQGLVSLLIGIAMEKGAIAYVGDGSNRWAAAHVTDTARLFRLALEKGEAGSKWHAVGEEGIPMKDIAEALARRLNLPIVSLSPEEAPAYFGFASHFIAFDAPASSKKTQERLGWKPTGTGLIEDLNNLVIPS